MKADFIFERSIKVKYKEMSEEDYVEYFICTCLWQNSLSIKELSLNLKENLHFRINLGKFSKYIEEKYIVCDEKVLLKEEQKKVMESTLQFQKNLPYLELEDANNLYSEIGKYISYGHFDIAKAIPYSLALDKSRSKNGEGHYLNIYYHLVLREQKNISTLENAIESIDPYYDGIPLKYIFRHKVILSLLFENGLYTVHDLKRVSVESLLLLFAPDFEDSVLCLSKLSEESKLHFKEDLKTIFLSLSERELDILTKRKGFLGTQMTLEEVGQCYGVTRERCRQIELKATSIIRKNAKPIYFQILAFFHSFTSQDKKRYVSIEEIRAFLEDDLLTNYLLFVVEVSSMGIKYNQELHILYHAKGVSLKKLC